MTNRETAIKAIEAWRANPATTFTPANILREFGDDILAALRAPAPEAFQARVRPWMLACFGPIIPFDKTERNHRFLEEALELVQSIGCTQSEAHQLVDYVFGREIGETPQEVGGVMVTLAALCIANDLDMDICGETELARIWTKVEKIRAKQAAKPKHSPLPEATPSTATTAVPAGYALVPLIPTKEQLEAGTDNNPTQWTDSTDPGFPIDVANDIYVSMVRAATPTPSDAMTVDAEELAIWLHNETDHPEHCPGYTWPENEHDDGRREGGFVKIVPKYAQEYFRDIARRMIAGPLSRNDRGGEA